MDEFATRFGGVARLYGAAGAARLRQARVGVVGIGGVGSWAAEALARSGIGHLTLVDFDDVCRSNTNRQLPALDPEWGRPKVEVMARRLRAINPLATVEPVQEFFTAENAARLLAAGFDYVVDAIDSPAKKCVLIDACRQRGLPLVCSGAAAGRKDPSQVWVVDLGQASRDRLLRETRDRLRTHYGFPRGEATFGIACVASREQVVYPARDAAVCQPDAQRHEARRGCGNHLGTACFVTGAFGLMMAAHVVGQLALAAPETG